MTVAIPYRLSNKHFSQSKRIDSIMNDFELSRLKRLSHRHEGGHRGRDDNLTQSGSIRFSKTGPATECLMFVTFECGDDDIMLC